MLEEPNQETPGAPSPLSRFGPLVGLLGTVAAVGQHSGAGLGIGWALLHGAGPLALLMLLPLVGSVGLIWAGFTYLRRRQSSRGLHLFAAHTFVLLALNEWLLPSTPLKAWSVNRSLSSAAVMNLTDEPVTTSAGTVGIRISFDIRFPRRTVASVSASAFTPPEGYPVIVPSDLDFSGYEQTIRPEPQEEDIYDVFEKDVVYRVEITRTPAFRQVDYLSKRPCYKPPVRFSEDEIVSALQRRGSRRYRFEIHFGSEHMSTSVPARHYETSRAYDLEEMYRSVLRERLAPCDQ